MRAANGDRSRLLSLPMPPISRLTTGMSNRNHMNVLTTLTIHDEVREVLKQNTPGTISSPHARNYTTNPWMPQDQLKHASHFSKELRSQSLLLRLIPRHHR